MMSKVALMASLPPRLRPLLAKVYAIKLPTGEEAIDQFCDDVTMLDPLSAYQSYDLEAYCHKTGRNYLTLAERAAKIEYDGHRPRWMAEALAVLADGERIDPGASVREMEGLE